MFRYLAQKSKKIAVTLNFSILSIFVTLFLISMISLIFITHTRFTKNITLLTFQLMNDASSSAFNLISNEMKNAEVKSAAVAGLIQLGILDPKDQPKLMTYTNHLMQTETKLYPSVQSIYWGDAAGDFVMAGKQNNGGIRSITINRQIAPPIQTLIERDSQGSTIRQSIGVNYDPRLRPWYTKAAQAKKINMA